MKTLIVIFASLASTLLASSDVTNAPMVLKIGSGVTLPSDEQYASGLLRYTGQHQGVTFCALSMDIGSAIPSGDFRLYAQIEGKYSKVLSLPMLSHKGYRCTCEADTLKVYLTRTYGEDKRAEDKELMLTIDLRKLVEAFAEPQAGGDGKPAPQP